MDKLIYKETDGDLTCRSRDFDKVFPTLYAYEETGVPPEKVKSLNANLEAMTALAQDLSDKLDQAKKERDALAAELKDERHRHDRYVDFELAEAQELAAYKAIGLTPEEIMKMQGEMKTAYDGQGDPYMVEATGNEAKHIIDLLVAEANGMLVVLPCKIDDPIYIILEEERQKRKPQSYRVEELDIDHFTIGGSMIPMITGCTKDNQWTELIDGSQVGHEYFLKKEEAEAALAKDTNVPTKKEVDHG